MSKRLKKQSSSKRFMSVSELQELAQDTVTMLWLDEFGDADTFSDFLLRSETNSLTDEDRELVARLRANPQFTRARWYVDLTRTFNREDARRIRMPKKKGQGA